MATRSEAQNREVSTRDFEPRTIENHNKHVQEVRLDPALSPHYGVKGGCPLTENLEHFHCVTGYPPDILHDLLEGIVPTELCLCISDFIAKKYFTLDFLNQTIKSFAYSFTDKTDQPQQIAKNFTSKGTIGGNGHENWTLLRLLQIGRAHV